MNDFFLGKQFIITSQPFYDLNISFLVSVLVCLCIFWLDIHSREIHHLLHESSICRNMLDERQTVFEKKIIVICSKSRSNMDYACPTIHSNKIRSINFPAILVIFEFLVLGIVVKQWLIRKFYYFFSPKCFCNFVFFVLEYGGNTILGQDIKYRIFFYFTVFSCRIDSQSDVPPQSPQRRSPRQKIGVFFIFHF